LDGTNILEVRGRVGVYAHLEVNVMDESTHILCECGRDGLVPIWCRSVAGMGVYRHLDVCVMASMVHLYKKMSCRDKSVSAH